MLKIIQLRFIILSFCGVFFCSSKSIAQHYTHDETTIGILIESNFSGFNHNGLTPSFTIGCATYQLQIGPRITFEQMSGDVIPNSKNSFWDFGYRYGFLLRDNFTLYASIHCEFASQRSTLDWFHADPSESAAPSIILTDYSFNARTDISHYNFNTYLGIGAEYILVDKLYLNGKIGAGFKTLSGYTKYSDRDTGELISESNWLFDGRGASWMISAGIGYRL